MFCALFSQKKKREKNKIKRNNEKEKKEIKKAKEKEIKKMRGDFCFFFIAF